MKLKVLFITLLLVYLLPMFIWWVAMSLISGYQISLNNSDWGAFGSFVGGVLSPIFSIISILFIVESLKKSEHNHIQTLENLAIEQRRSHLFSLSEAFQSALDRSAHEIKHGLGKEAWEAMRIEESVRANLYSYNRAYNKLSEEQKEMRYALVGNLITAAEHSFMATLDTIISEPDEYNRDNLISIVLATHNFNDLVELINYEKKSLIWSNLKYSPLLDKLVTLNKENHLFKDMVQPYSQVRPNI